MKALLVLALLAGATTAFAAEAPQGRAAREALNVEVLLKHYPSKALAAGDQGPVFFKVSLDRDGVPTGCEVTASSGHVSLDTATCDLILLYTRFQPDHNERGGKTAMTHEGVINWAIPGAAQLPVGELVVVAKTDPMDRRVCKRALRTGSLAAFERTCMTVREWATQSDDQKKVWADEQAGKGFTNGR